jgi:uncharacterized protein
MKYSDSFYEIVDDILKNKEFDKLKLYTHHGITRHEHCLRVAYYTYVVCKALHLNYIEATRAALLHDFFTDEVSKLKAWSRFRTHPTYALKNSKKYYKLSSLQEDIIIRHMFPVTFIPPKYIESWIVDIVDDGSAIYDKIYSMRKQLAAIFNSIIIFIIGFFKI